MFASDISAEGWTAILVAVIGAFFVGLTSLVTQVVGMILQHIRDRDVANKVAQVAVKAEEVKTALESVAATQNTKLDNVAVKIEQVHKATNSLTDRLVESTAKESHAAGVKEEKERLK